MVEWSERSELLLFLLRWCWDRQQFNLFSDFFLLIFFSVVSHFLLTMNCDRIFPFSYINKKEKRRKSIVIQSITMFLLALQMIACFVSISWADAQTQEWTTRRRDVEIAIYSVIFLLLFYALYIVYVCSIYDRWEYWLRKLNISYVQWSVLNDRWSHPYEWDVIL